MKLKFLLRYQINFQDSYLLFGESVLLPVTWTLACLCVFCKLLTLSHLRPAFTLAQRIWNKLWKLIYFFTWCKAHPAHKCCTFYYNIYLKQYLYSPMSILAAYYKSNESHKIAQVMLIWLASLLLIIPFLHLLP